MTPEKKEARHNRNLIEKDRRAEAQKANMALLGKLVFEKQVPTGQIDNEGKLVTKAVPDFPPAIRTAKDGSILPLLNDSQPRPRKNWSQYYPRFLGGKLFKQSGPLTKGRPGNHLLHSEAIVEDASRAFAKEVDKVLNPPEAEATPVPVVPENAAGEVAQL